MDNLTTKHADIKYEAVDLRRFVDLYEAFYDYLFAFIRSYELTPFEARVFYLEGLMELYAVDVPVVGFNNIKAFLLSHVRSAVVANLKEGNCGVHGSVWSARFKDVPKDRYISFLEGRGLLRELMEKGYEKDVFRLVIRHGVLLEGTTAVWNVPGVSNEVAEEYFYDIWDMLKVLVQCHLYDF